MLALAQIHPSSKAGQQVAAALGAMHGDPGRKSAALRVEEFRRSSIFQSLCDDIEAAGSRLEVARAAARAAAAIRRDAHLCAALTRLWSAISGMRGGAASLAARVRGGNACVAGAVSGGCFVHPCGETGTACAAF